MTAENLFKGFEFNPEYIEREMQRTDHAETADVKRRTADWTESDFSSFNRKAPS